MMFKRKKKEPTEKEKRIAEGKKRIRMFVKGSAGIKNPVDIDGTPIKEGDILSYDFGDNKYPQLWMYQPCFKVKKIEDDKFVGDADLYGKGINMSLYLHDFRFKFARVIKEDNGRVV